MEAKYFTAAHTVVIKGVKVFQNGATKEYSDLDIMQMIGRAVSFSNIPNVSTIDLFDRAAHNMVKPQNWVSKTDY